MAAAISRTFREFPASALTGRPGDDAVGASDDPVVEMAARIRAEWEEADRLSMTRNALVGTFPPRGSRTAGQEAVMQVLDDALRATVGNACDMQRELWRTPAASLAGVLAKLHAWRDYTVLKEMPSGQPVTLDDFGCDDQGVVTAIADLERLSEERAD